MAIKQEAQLEYTLFVGPKSILDAFLKELFPSPPLFHKIFTNLKTVEIESRHQDPAQVPIHMGIRVQDLAQTMDKITRWCRQKQISCKMEPVGKGKEFVTIPQSTTLELIEAPAIGIDHYAIPVTRLNLAIPFLQNFGWELEKTHVQGPWGEARFLRNQKQRIQLSQFKSFTLLSGTTQYPLTVRTHDINMTAQSIVRMITNYWGHRPHQVEKHKGMFYWSEAFPLPLLIK